MGEIDVVITHEMIFKRTAIYSITDLRGLIKVFNSFVNIEEIKFDGKYLKLYGTQRILGYKIENDGFYDVCNDVYYPPIFVDNKQVIELTQHIKKKVR